MPFIGKQSTSNSQITNYTTTVGSGGQTNFTVVIEGGDETHVYLNGVLLKETTDYTVSSTQVSLVSPAVENDIVEIKVFRSFALVDAVKASDGGTFSGDVTVPNLTLSSNVIKASDGGSTITLDTSDNVTLAGNLVIPNGGNIGSVSDTDAITISSTGKVTTADSELNIKTTSHTFTVKGVDSAIGDSQSGTAPDTSDSDSGQFAVYNGSTRLFGITEHGYVLTPKAVWFHAYNGATQDTSLPDVAIEVVEFTSAQQDSSNSYSTSNYTFTAPVSGVYHFSYGWMNNTTEYGRHSFFLNGSEVNERFLLNYTYANASNAMTRSLVAGDSVNVRVNTNSESAGGHVHSDFRVFTGFLIG